MTTILILGGIIAPRLLVLSAVLTCGVLPLVWVALIFIWPFLYLMKHPSAATAKPIIMCVSLTVNSIAAVIAMLIIWQPVKFAFLRGIGL